ncbi:hypothetical protein CVT24_011417 [Panaeolus cyanescens]|uniref:WSC domain-containing protein n=1 Tax=Panaeolus cyanescens TaxID=181874 RepID=A0A409VG71_9AGAR|nr:hypothetical protein CVT24_011417 [Panaeolus cyanescens]
MSSNSRPQPSQIPSLVPAPAGWTYIGCYEDSMSRTLDGGYRNTQDMTIMSCISVCQGNGFSIAGVEGGYQCYCANTIKAGAVKKTETECGMACVGDDLLSAGRLASQRCGDLWRLNIYQAQLRPAAPTTSTSSTFSSDTIPPQAPAPLPTTSNRLSTATTSTDSSTGTQRSFTRAVSETTLITVTSDTHSSDSPSSASISTALILPSPVDQIFTPNDTHSAKSAPSSAVVAGIAVATTAIAAILVALVIFTVRKWRRRNIEQTAMTQHGIIPAPYNKVAYHNTSPEDLPVYADFEGNFEGAAIHTSPHLPGSGRHTKVRLRPSH